MKNQRNDFTINEQKFVQLDKSEPKLKIIGKSKHKKHPTIAKIDSHVDENGQLVVDCPDLWARKLKIRFLS